MKHYLKNDDEVVANNLKLKYDNGKFIAINKNFEYEDLCIYDSIREIGYDIKCEMIDDIPKFYYERP